jgi:glycosyltransferase involved in cell wall biosynthesis
VNPEISLFFPVYNDEKTVEAVTRKSIDVLSQLTKNWEIIIINDGSPDKSGQIADELSLKYPQVKVIHHETNKGYGAAIRRGLQESQGDLIFFTDGDDEYDVYDFLKIYKFKDFYDLIITFRYKKLYSSKRIFISFVYNFIFRRIFGTPYRDISTGLRAIKKSVTEDLSLTSNSPFIGAELTLKTKLKGYRIGEVGIQTFPRVFGSGSSTSLRNIKLTLLDMFKVYNEVFSDHYDLPNKRNRGN